MTKATALRDRTARAAPAGGKRAAQGAATTPKARKKEPKERRSGQKYTERRTKEPTATPAP
ncbi:MAG: hypothetical protein ACOYEL_07435 [Saccharofermentanales bacterium]